jgi:hypothetical protein
MGGKLIELLVKEKKIQLAARVTGDLAPNDSEKPTVGQVSNGGFESEVKLRNANMFEWQISEGQAPQIGISSGEKHGGNRSLMISFGTTEPAAFRSITQMVPVVSGATYELEAFYRSDLKTSAVFKWEIVDAGTGNVIAGTPGIKPAGDWTSLTAKFTVPAGSDGVIVRFTRDTCGSCSANGKLSFDDISLKRL